LIFSKYRFTFGSIFAYTHTMAQRNVYVFYSHSLNEFYFGETEDHLDKLYKMNTGYYDTLKAITKANDWVAQLVIPCQSKQQAVKVLKHLNSKSSSIYIKNLSLHKGLVDRLLKRFSDLDNVDYKQVFVSPVGEGPLI